jgi:hypothetical protein
MSLDLVAAVELTASASVVVAVLAIGFGRTTGGRVRIAFGLALWFVLVTILAAFNLLTYPGGLGAPGLGVAVFTPMVVLVVMVRRSPTLSRSLRAAPLSLLVGVHAIRILGWMFLALYAVGRLPAPFAPLAGAGDFLTGITALPLAWALARGRARRALWLWNGFGLLDLVTAIGLGVVSAPGPTQVIVAPPGTTMMTSLPWLIIPAFLVPLLALLHLGIFQRLRRD